MNELLFFITGFIGGGIVGAYIIMKIEQWENKTK